MADLLEIYCWEITWDVQRCDHTGRLAAKKYFNEILADKFIHYGYKLTTNYVEQAIHNYQQVLEQKDKLLEYVKEKLSPEQPSFDELAELGLPNNVMMVQVDEGEVQ